MALRAEHLELGALLVDFDFLLIMRQVSHYRSASVATAEAAKKKKKAEEDEEEEEKAREKKSKEKNVWT